MQERFIRMNVELPGFAQGQQWPYNEAPDAVKKWFENKSILFETTICSIVEYDMTNSILQEVVYDKSTITTEHEDNILFRKFNTIETKKAEESGVKEVVRKTKRKKKKATSKKKSYNSNAPKCKGIKRDGYPCKTTKLLDNGYCRHHQNQASIQDEGVS